jgi:hypothetical protein
MSWFTFTSAARGISAGAGVPLVAAIGPSGAAHACGVCMTSLTQSATRDAYITTALILSLAGMALLVGFFWLVFQRYARSVVPRPTPAAGGEQAEERPS